MAQCEAAGGDRDPRQARLPLSGLRLLIVEDSPEYRAAMRGMAAALGAVVDTVDTGEAGAAALASGGYDLAVVDIGLPDMSGGAVVAGARDCGAALLAVSSDDDGSGAPAAHAFAPKPFASVAAFGEAALAALAAKRC
ncbi:MAG: response regulator [Rhodobacteraceae bacterium]|nr:MAG: response regulator [Paracoccaceae bacterium]